MEAKKKTTSNHFEAASGVLLKITNSSGKDTKHFPNPTTQKVYDLLMLGGKHSVVDICRALNTPDPRSHIRFIRNAGVHISDYWIKTAFSKFKIYFIKP
jgi:hypothetical protein